MNNEPKPPRSGFTPVRVIALIIWLAAGQIFWMPGLVHNIHKDIFWLTFCFIALIVGFISLLSKKNAPIVELLIDIIAWLTVAASVIAILFVGFVFASCLLK